MKLLLVMLLLIFPLLSSAGAYRWVDENGNVHFGSKPKPAKQEPVLKAEPKVELKAPPEKPGVPVGAETTVDEISPAAVLVEVHVTSTNKKPPVSARNSQAAKPAPEPPVGAKGKEPKAEPVKPAIDNLPAPDPVAVTPAAEPKTEIKPTPKPAKKTARPTVPKAVKPAPKPTPQKQQKKATKPAKKKVAAKKKPAAKPARKKKVANKKPASRPTVPAAAASNDKNAELCGIFNNYVSDYQNKLIDCQGASCNIYEKSLAKYQKKQKSYCH